MPRTKQYGFMLYLSERQKKALVKYAKEAEVSQAYFVRTALEDKIGNIINSKTYIKK